MVQMQLSQDVMSLSPGDAESSSGSAGVHGSTDELGEALTSLDNLLEQPRQPMPFCYASGPVVSLESEYMRTLRKKVLT